MPMRRSQKLSEDLNELYKSLSKLRTLLWSSAKLKLDDSEQAIKKFDLLSEQTSSLQILLENFSDACIAEFYKTKMVPGSLIVMTSFWSPESLYLFANTTFPSPSPETCPKIESGDIFLYLGLVKEETTSEKLIPEWLINGKKYKLNISITSFKVLSKNVKGDIISLIASDGESGTNDC